MKFQTAIAILAVFVSVVAASPDDRHYEPLLDAFNRLNEYACFAEVEVGRCQSCCYHIGRTYDVIWAEEGPYERNRCFCPEVSEYKKAYSLDIAPKPDCSFISKDRDCTACCGHIKMNGHFEDSQCSCSGLVERASNRF